MPNKLIPLLLAICMIICLASCKSSSTDNSNALLNVLQSNQSNNPQPSDHIHVYSEATCNSPKACSCGATAGVELGHKFSPATCTSPEICSRCGTTNGSELGHDYSDATCNSPKTCTRCEETSGNVLDHDYIDNVCSLCGKVDPDSLPVGLHELFLIDSYEYEYRNGTFTDSFGNTYDGVHYYTDLYESNNGKMPHSMFNLDSKYKTFTGSIVTSPSTSSTRTFYVNIYIDEVIVYSTTGFSKTSGKVDFEIDVTNGKTVKIEAGLEGRSGSYDHELGIVNAQLTK